MQVDPPASSWALAEAPALCTLKDTSIAFVPYTDSVAAETCAVDTNDKLIAKTTLTIMRNIRLHNIFDLSNEVGLIHNQFNTVLPGINPLCLACHTCQYEGKEQKNPAGH